MTKKGSRPAPPATPESIVELLYRDDGDRAKRPVHTIGIAVEGSFKPSAVAPRYCRAAHFQPRQGGHPVIVRFSNGSGCKDPHDNWSDVRGMATRFAFATPDWEMAYTDLIAMTLPLFFSSTPDEFQDFAIAANPVPYEAEPPLRKFKDMLNLTLPLRNPYPGETISPDLGAITFAQKHDVAKPAVLQAASIGAPVCYLRAAYHAVHTFIVTNQQGVERPVRFSWQPVLGVRTMDPAAPYDPSPSMTNGDRYLQDRLRRAVMSSVGKDRPRFTLMMTIGEAGDALEDPSRAWPPHRTRIMMGTLAITSIQPNPDDWESISFNPGLVTDGIALSDDPVLKFRVATYKWSSTLRKGAACPFSGASTNDPQA